MRTDRVEVRLDPETRGRLEKMAQARGSSVSDLVRAMIERSYDEELNKARIAAAERIGKAWFENVPEASVLKEQFAQAHEPE